MSDAVIGRMLVASLHQAIAEILPERLEFYESWLNSKRMRSSRVTLGGMRAVFSFLRQEDGQYDAVMRRAGVLTAQWTVDGLSPFRKTWLRRLPWRFRVRAACRLAAHIASATWVGAKARVRWQRGTGQLALQPSLFCDVRTSSETALCAYYGSVVIEIGRVLDVELTTSVEACQARAGQGHCTIAIEPTRPAEGVSVIAPLVVAFLIAGGAAVSAQTTSPVAPARERVMVMPFENETKDPRLVWLGEGAAILLKDALRAAGADVMRRDERLKAFERLQVPPQASLSRATVIRLGQLVGAADVVIGSVAAQGDLLVFSARRLRLWPGRLESPVTERGKIADVFACIRRIAAGLAPAPAAAGAGSERPVAAAPADPPLVAFEAYIRGLLAQAPAAQVKFFHTALQAAPDYDAVRVALWQAHTQVGEYRAALEAVRGVPDSSPVALEARFLASVSLVHVGEYTEAYRVLNSLRPRAPSAIIQNNLGVVRLRASSLPSDALKATAYFTAARALDPLDPDYVFNLGYASWLEGDPELAASWLREAVRLGPGDGAAHALLATVLQASGQAAEAGRELSLAQRLSSAYDTLDLKAAAAAPPRGMARLKDEIAPPRSERADASVEMIGQSDQRDMAMFYLERARRLAEQDNDREAEAEVKRALYLAPYDAAAHLLLGRICLRSGRTRDAIEAFKISLWSKETAAAHVALAEAYLDAHSPDLARGEAERALAMEPESAAAKQVLDRVKREPGPTA